MNPKGQSSDSQNAGSFNAGTGGDLSSGYDVHPAGEAQFDDLYHKTGLNGDSFDPLVAVKPGQVPADRD